MSATANSTVRQERDRLSRAVVYGGATALALILIAGWFFTWLVERPTPIHVGLERAAAPLETVPREINMVDQTLFSAHVPSRGDWDAKRRALDSYGWADRDRRVVRIPVDRAMQLLVERGHVE